MQTTVPPKVLELSEFNQLGEFVRYHGGRTFISITRKVVPDILLISIIFALFMVWWIKYASPSHPLIISLFVFFITFCLYFFISGSSQVFRVYLKSAGGQRVYEFAGGIIAVKGQRLHLLSWKDIFTLTYTPAGNAGPIFQITTSNNKKYTLYCDTVIPRIEQELIRRDLSGKLACYEAGETLTFGTIRVNKEGITRSYPTKRKNRQQPDKTVSWSELYPQMSERGFMLSFIRLADGKSFRISLYNKSNACVLKALLAAITASAFSL